MTKKESKIGVVPDLNDLFLVSENHSFTYHDLSTFAHYFKNKMMSRGVSLNSPIGLHAQSSNELSFIIAACWLQQIPFISFNPNRTINFRQLSGELKLPLVISDNPDSRNSELKLSIRSFDMTKILSNDREANLRSAATNLSADPEEPFGYFFTSGTSGSPKLVPLKRRQILLAAASSAKNIRPLPSECWLLCLPLHHVGGVSVILRSILYGSAIYQIDRYDRQKINHLLANKKSIVAASLVPTMLQRMIRNQTVKTHANFKAILLGGGPIDATLLKSCIDRNIPIVASYGMTETCAQISANPVDKAIDEQRLNSAGQIFKPNNIEIRNKSGYSLSTGVAGTIWLKGPQIFDGYLKGDQDKFDSKGWFNTGDYGQIDVDNYLYIKSRRTDLIITGGENVSPYEVEGALKKINRIQEAAVFGMRDEDWGQKVAALIIRADDITKDDILQSLKQLLEPYKIPKDIGFVDTFPRTVTGKIKRSKLPSLMKSAL